MPVNRNVPVNQNEVSNARVRKPRKVPAASVPPVLADAGLVPASSLPPPRRCTHAGKRYVGGYCKDCDHLILTGGEWA